MKKELRKENYKTLLSLKTHKSNIEKIFDEEIKSSKKELARLKEEGRLSRKRSRQLEKNSSKISITINDIDIEWEKFMVA